jgi:hypothetical protein
MRHRPNVVHALVERREVVEGHAIGRDIGGMPDNAAKQFGELSYGDMLKLR